MDIPVLPIVRGAADKKTTFHRRAKAFLTDLATEVLKLTPDQYEIRTNKGGPAVCGETVLHTDPVVNGKGLYVMVSCFETVPAERKVLMRTCKGRKDYTGGQNNLLTLEEAITMAKGIKNGTGFFEVR